MTDDTDATGLVIVYTGDGKGKTTAALGLCLRAVGHGNKVRIIQFIKSDWPYGEREGLKRLAPEVELDIRGAGCIGILGDDLPIEAHRDAARQAMAAAEAAVGSGKYDMVILDEVHIATRYQLIAVEDVLNLIRNKPAGLTLVMTGRCADERVIAAADLVTEMKEIKHPYQSGRKAKKGVDY